MYKCAQECLCAQYSFQFNYDQFCWGGENKIMSHHSCTVSHPGKLARKKTALIDLPVPLSVSS